MTTETIVCYRQYSDGSVIACFPGIKANNHNYDIMTYCLAEQHGTADYTHVVQQTAPAPDTDYVETHQQLLKLGYRLRVVKRITSNHFWYSDKKASAHLWSNK